MRKLLAWLAGLVSVAALAKLLSRRRRSEAGDDPIAAEPDPADELRRKLDEARSQEATATAPAPPEPAPEEPATSQPTIDERRAAVHAKAQEAIDAMRGTDG